MEKAQAYKQEVTKGTQSYIRFLTDAAPNRVVNTPAGEQTGGASVAYCIGTCPPASRK